jgi:hypothetical protein
MYLINDGTKSLTPLVRKKFSEIGFSERNDLQEWLANHPEALGEKLLIIQKEFNGFADTYERLDLLALDKNRNIVIIENKLDDSGKDVTWQAIKYASYCSTLSKEQIREIYQTYLNVHKPEADAQKEILDFLEEVDFSELVLNQKQRIVLVAANFRKEVTSTVMWLMNFKIQVQCFKATAYELDGQYFLTIDQIIPIKDAQDYIISMTNKAQEEISTEEEVKSRHRIRQKFWTEFLKTIKGKSSLFQNSNPTKDNWLVAGGTGITYVSYQAIVSYAETSVVFHFGRNSTQENKILFDAFCKHKDEIEKEFGEKMEWERMNDNKSSKISFSKAGLTYFNQDDWPQIISFLLEHVNKLEKAVKPFLTEAKATLNAASKELDESLAEEQTELA